MGGGQETQGNMVIRIRAENDLRDLFNRDNIRKQGHIMP